MICWGVLIKKMTTKNDLEELQKRLDKLKKQKEFDEKQLRGLEIQPTGKLPGLGQQFEEVGKTMGQLKDLIPKKKTKDKPKQNYVEDPFVVKMKKWLLIGLTVLVGGGAAIMVVAKIIGRVFG